MIAVAQADLRRMLARRGLILTSVIVPVAIVLVLVGVRIFLHSHNPVAHTTVGGETLFAFVSIIGIVSVVFGTVIGAMFGAEDVTSGTLRYILLTGFSRLRLFVTRIPVLAIVAVGVALPAFVLLLIAALVLPHAGEPGVTAGDGGRLLLSLVLNVGIYALIAYGIGVAIRSTGGAIAVALGLNLIGISLFNLITLAVPGVKPWLLDNALTRVTDGGDTSIAIAIVALIVWPAAFLAVGLVRALRTEA
ncbi:MAG: hypothetical protein WCO40_09770 [Thermoleophilia bacterium]